MAGFSMDCITHCSYNSVIYKSSYLQETIILYRERWDRRGNSSAFYCICNGRSGASYYRLRSNVISIHSIAYIIINNNYEKARVPIMFNSLLFSCVHCHRRSHRILCQSQILQYIILKYMYTTCVYVFIFIYI